MSIYKCNWCRSCFAELHKDNCYVKIIEKLPNKNLRVLRLQDNHNGCLVAKSDLKKVSKIEQIMLAKTYPDVV